MKYYFIGFNNNSMLEFGSVWNNRCAFSLFVFVLECLLYYKYSYWVSSMYTFLYFPVQFLAPLTRMVDQMIKCSNVQGNRPSQNNMK